MKIFLSVAADKQLKMLLPKMHEVILDRIQLLASSPIPPASKKLINREGWRIRVGDYRILYTIDRKRNEITILSVRHRKDAYRF